MILDFTVYCSHLQVLWYTSTFSLWAMHSNRLSPESPFLLHNINRALLNCGDIFYHQRTRTAYRLWNSSNSTGNSTRQASAGTSQLPLFPLGLAGKLSQQGCTVIIASWWQQPTEMSHRTELTAWDAHSHLPPPGSSCRSTEHSGEGIKRDPFPLFAPGLGSYRLPAEFRPCFIFYSPQPQPSFNEPLCNAA